MHAVHVTVRAILNVDTTLHLRRDKAKAQFCKKNSCARAGNTRAILAGDGRVGGAGGEEGGKENGKRVYETHIIF